MLTKILNDFLFGSSAPGGDFQSVLDDDMVPFEEDVQGFLRQTLEALDFIHERNIAHLDIKVGRAVVIRPKVDMSVTRPSTVHNKT